MRLTVELVSRAETRVNPVLEWELVLRGYQIPALENLGVTKDQFDSIDLTDNEITRLENFPPLPRLRTLLLSSNLLSRIDETTGEKLNHLRTLILSNNRISSLTEIDSLASLTTVETLSLLHNPVTKRPHYRLYVIHKMPRLYVLDFKRIRPKEREAARALFESKEGRQLKAAVARAREFIPVRSASSSSSGLSAAGGGGGGATSTAGPTFSSEQLAAIHEMVSQATTPEEIDRLEAALRDGQLPEALRGRAKGTGADRREQTQEEAKEEDEQQRESKSHSEEKAEGDAHMEDEEGQ